MKYKRPRYENRHEKFFFKHYGEISEVSRKTKKYLLGKKQNRRQLKQRLAAVVITKNKYPRCADISDQFCPRCGCNRTRCTGNMAPEPEVWVQTFCLRCGFLVGEADNSPYVHALECAEWSYEIG